MFEGWDDFYLLVGSSSGALIGLLFVVATLTSGVDRTRAARGQALFMTPNVFHFAVVLTVSGVAMAPKLSPAVEGALVGAIGVYGAAYGGYVAWQIPKGEVAHWSDLWCYGCLPATLHLALAGCGVAVASGWAYAPHATAAVCLALLFTGIRNAWDLVTWLAPRGPEGG